ncbi:collagen alpha-6(VI) chain-like [Saccostrea echinata]|uniref:collagen alpha-6(VI) chain-like n=1 Tax=Saccostrea echinata TaxID=191078 RepID=UPI002A7FF881|nr:collagen alpha-6(VI) chain-like [Saccostrea echinata]
MTPEGFSDVLHFVENLVGKFTISRSTVQVGLVTFSSTPHREFDLNSYSDDRHLQSAIHHVSFTAKQTDTLSALKFVHTSSFEHERGARPSSSHIVILLTDGVVTHSHPPSHQSHGQSSHGQDVQTELNHTIDLMQSKGIDVIAIGVNVRNANLLTRITRDPSNYFAVSDSADLNHNADAVAQRICAVARQRRITTTPGLSCVDKVDNCYQFEKYYCMPPYETWARTNCPAYCGYCNGGSPTYSYSTATTSSKPSTTRDATTTISDITTSTTNTPTKTLLTTAQISQVTFSGSVNKTECPTCDETLSCVWNQTCDVSNVCMVRSVSGRKFNTHCIRADDCEIMKSFVLSSGGGEIYCCWNRECLWKYLGV